MPSLRKNIPDENKQDDQDLDFTPEELDSELDRIFKVESIQPGDVTLADLQERYGISHQHVRRKMKIEIEAGRWVQFETIVNGHRIVAFRRVNKA